MFKKTYNLKYNYCKKKNNYNTGEKVILYIKSCKCHFHYEKNLLMFGDVLSILMNASIYRKKSIISLAFGNASSDASILVIS